VTGWPHRRKGPLHEDTKIRAAGITGAAEAAKVRIAAPATALAALVHTAARFGVRGWVLRVKSERQTMCCGWV